MLNRRNVILFLVLITLMGLSASIKPLETLSITTLFVLSLILFILYKKNPTVVLAILLNGLLLSLFFLPSFNIGDISIRLDDLIAVYMTLFLITFLYKSKKKRLATPKIVKIILVYILFSFLVTLVRMIFGDLSFVYILFFIKEIQYFIYFATAYIFMKHTDSDDPFFKTFYIASLITIAWGVLQLLTGGIRGYYGIGIISVQNPSQSGIVFYLITFVLFYLSHMSKNKFKAYFLLILSILAGGLTIATISRTAILVLFFSAFIYFAITLFKRKHDAKKILISICIFSFSLILSYKIIEPMITHVLERFSRFSGGSKVRTGNWEYFLSHSDKLGYIVGNGKGFMQEIVGTFTLKADNQYVRLIIESGVVGLLLWLAIIISIIFIAFKAISVKNNSAVLLLIITTGFLFIGITQEAYLVAIQGSLYWIISGVLLAKVCDSRYSEKA